MANYRGHMRGGFVTFAFIVFFAIPHYPPSVLTMLEWFLFTIAGSLFPDVDIKSKGQKYFYQIMLVLFIVLALNHHYRQLAVISVLSLTPLLVKHRGIFHRLWFVIAVPLATWYCLSLQFPQLREALLMNSLFFVAGAISHLWLDRGIKIFSF